MYFSEFTLKLIEYVKNHEILYNTKYEKRPKTEKEEAWKQIAKSLDSDSEKCKKHWKNIRDRFVKVMHARTRHFANGLSELDAPQYIYYDKLQFMQEFSVQKEPHVEVTTNVSVSTTISPDRLIFEEYKESPGESVSYLDYTNEFLQHIKKFPVLFDQHAEMRKYRSKEAWKQLADLMGGKFTVGRLRHYWITLLRKYKMYLENTHQCDPIENENLFESLSFVNIGIQVKKEETSSDIQFIVQTDEMDSSQEFYEDLNEEEHLMCEEVEDEGLLEKASQDEETVQAIESLQETSEPSPKKRKIEITSTNVLKVADLKSFSLPNFLPKKQAIPDNPPASAVQPQTSHSEPSPDEFDYFGKKVALQLRDLAQKNRMLARKGEIRVLQLLMELEETLEG